MAKRKRRKKFQFLYRKFSKKMQLKLVGIFLVVVLAFLFLVIKVTQINVTKGEKYTKTVLDQQQYNSRTIPFKRGDILDTNGTKIATSERVYNVILDVKELLDTQEGKYVDYTVEKLVELFGVEEEELREIIKEKKGSRYVILKKGIDYDTNQKFEQQKEKDEEENKKKKDQKQINQIVGVWMEDDYIRKYPYNTLASDVIGFTASGNVGNVGLEASYNTILNGTDGREYGYQDEDATLARTVKEPVNGNHIVTTIDVNLQSIVEKHILALNETYKGNYRKEDEGAKNIAVMMMDPNTGAILAMASYPNFDLNNPRDLTKYYKQEVLDAMSAEETAAALNSLWKNFCISDTFEPGSTIKPFTMAAGFETGKLSGDEIYNCTGSLERGGHTIRCIETEGHGPQTVKQVLEHSCNVGLMEIAEQLGKEDFSKYQKIFGFGEYTGIDLPGEGDTSGLLYEVNKMGEADLATNSFGQNFNVTMTQLAAGFCSLINGGNYYEPYLVKQIQNDNGDVVENKTPTLLKKTISEETSEILKDYMLGVVEEGSGKKAQVEGYAIGGKTGTAEKHPRSEGKNLNSFIGYVPQKNPEVVIYTIVDEPNLQQQAASYLASGLAADIMEEALPYLGVTKEAQ